MDTRTTIGAIVAADYRTANVFKKYGIDFCCNGNRTIEDACTPKGIDPTQVIEELDQVSKGFNGDNDVINFQSWPLDLLADYIEKKHHRYVATQIPTLQGYLTKIAAVHGKQHPELLEIKELFDECAEDLTAHMKKEETVLFPLVRKRAAAGPGTQNEWFTNIGLPIRVMMHEHDTEGARFRKIATLSNNYEAPADGCNTYKVTYNLLREFEADLHMHIHLENNILFPKAMTMNN